MQHNTYFIYLDLNIIDSILKKRVNLRIPDQVRIIYSTETLNEINRARINSEDRKAHLPFLEFLNNQNAIYLSYHSDHIGITDYRQTWKETPENIFNDYLDNTTDYQPLDEKMNFLIHKIYGGQETNSLSELSDNLQKEIHKLLDNLTETYKNTDMPNLNSEIEKIRNEIEPSYQNLNKIDLLDDPIIDDPIKFFRDHYSLSPRELNNIKSPYIENICDLKGISLEKANEIYENFIKILPTTPSLTLKIHILYNALNMIGFYPDKNINDLKKFNASLSDNSHACYATFANLFLTHDEKMYKKISAVYEFLNIKTICKLIPTKK